MFYINKNIDLFIQKYIKKRYYTLKFIREIIKLKLL